MANLKKTMFREYDLRGQVNDSELNEKSMEIICRAYATMLHKRNIKKAVVGHDYRSYSEKLKNAAIKGLTQSGIDVIDLGMVLAPMVYASQYYYQCQGGVVITASHNPNGWSGVKQSLGYSHTLVPNEMKELYELTISEKFVNGKGNVVKKNCFNDYRSDLLKRIKINRPLKVVVNTGNGAAGPYIVPILKEAGLQVFELNTELDWNFPHYSPNPAKLEMMEDTGKHVVQKRADIGIAIDADGDRLGITDEKGQLIWPDRYLILLARQVLEKVPGSKIVFDVKCTQALEDDIKAHGGIPVMWITGHSYIKAKMKEVNAPLAGEMSGHIFIGKPIYYGFDDAVFVALKLLEYISEQKEPLSAVIAKTPYFVSSPTWQVNCADEVKYQIVDKLTKEFKDEGYEVIDINGARVKFKDGWGLVRASSNLPVLVLRFEAKTQDGLERIEKLFKEKLVKYPEIGSKWESG